MIKIEKEKEITFLNASVTDFTDSLGYCEYKIPLSIKGEKKDLVLDLIRKYIAYRMTNDEMLVSLKNRGENISSRTLSRYKQEIKKQAGDSVLEIYKNEIVGNILDDIYGMKEIQRQCWIEYDKSKTGGEKLKALSLIRNTTLDKHKLYLNIPFGIRNQKFPNPTDIDETSGDGSKTLKN